MGVRGLRALAGLLPRPVTSLAAGLVPSGSGGEPPKGLRNVAAHQQQDHAHPGSNFYRLVSCPIPQIVAGTTISRT